MYYNEGISCYADFFWRMINFSKKLKNEKILSMYFFFCIRIYIQKMLLSICMIILNFVAFLVLIIFSIIENQSILIDLKKIKRLRLIRLSLDKIVFPFQRKIRLRKLAL